MSETKRKPAIKNGSKASFILWLDKMSAGIRQRGFRTLLSSF